MHAYICHSIYLSVPVKVEQALEKSEENSRTSAKKCPLIVSVDANNKEKGSPMEVDWKLSSGSWTDNPCAVRIQKLFPVMGALFRGIKCCHDILPTTINQTFKSTDKEKERQWDKIMSVPWEKGGIQRFYSRSLKVYFLRAKKWLGTQNGEQVNEGKKLFMCAACPGALPGAEAERNLVRILLYCIMNDEGKCLAQPHLRSDKRVFRWNGFDQQLPCGTKIGIKNSKPRGAIGKC